MVRNGSRWSGVALALAVVLGGGLAGCSDVQDAVDRAGEEVRERTDEAVSDAVAGRVREELEKVGVSLDAAPECDPDVDLSGLDTVQGSVRCTGRTTEGEDVQADFTGEFGPSTCTGELVVTVGGEEKVRSPDLSVCSG